MYLARWTAHLMAWTAPVPSAKMADVFQPRRNVFMPVVTVGLDLAKTVFQAHGVDDVGQTVLRRRLGRSELLAYFAKLPPCLIAMEACSSAHHWARELVTMGHDVRLIPPQYVKPYVKRNKTDAADAEAICEAATRPNMRFVPIKTRDQQAVLALHRSRSLLVRQRTASINAVRGLVGEFGLIAAKGRYRMSELRQRMNAMTPDHLPAIACQAINTLFDHINTLEGQIAAVEQQIVEWHKNNEDSRRLATAPGVGPITASAIVAAVGDGRQFQSARHFAAWLGLTPRMHASGKKERIGRISKGGDRHLRALLIHGARAIVGTLFRKNVPPRPWLLPLKPLRLLLFASVDIGDDI
ncbi:IS110 family transposase [Rhizobium altiplani]|nr:IS110 family transposase [Rhizobium altiplani]